MSREKRIINFVDYFLDHLYEFGDLGKINKNLIKIAPEIYDYLDLYGAWWNYYDKAIVVIENGKVKYNSDYIGFSNEILFKANKFYQYIKDINIELSGISYNVNMNPRSDYNIEIKLSSYLITDNTLNNQLVFIINNTNSITVKKEKNFIDSYSYIEDPISLDKEYMIKEYILKWINEIEEGGLNE